MKLKSFCLIALLVGANSTTLFALNYAQRQDLIEDLVRVESAGKANAVGDNGKAYGILQIHSVMVAEANRIARTNYTHTDMFKPQKAREVAEIVLRHYDRVIEQKTGKPATAKHLAFIWNGGASAWKRVDAPVNDQKQRNLESYWRKVSAAQKR